MTRYMIGPDVTMQLAYQEAAIGAGHQRWDHREERC
jgi:hypothetical protein